MSAMTPQQASLAGQAMAKRIADREPDPVRVVFMMTTMIRSNDSARVGDTVTGFYHDAPIRGVLTSFAGQIALVRLTEPCNLGFRVEPAGEEVAVDLRRGAPLRAVAWPVEAPEVRRLDGVCWASGS